MLQAISHCEVVPTTDKEKEETVDCKWCFVAESEKK